MGCAVSGGVSLPHGGKCSKEHVGKPLSLFLLPESIPQFLRDPIP